MRALAEIQARSEPTNPSAAEGTHRLALALEMRSLQVNCHVGLGKLPHGRGHLGEAHAELTIAVEMLGEMGMTLGLPEAGPELVQVTPSGWHSVHGSL